MEYCRSTRIVVYCWAPPALSLHKLTNSQLPQPPPKWSFLHPIPPERCVFCYPSPYSPLNMGFISLFLIPQNYFGTAVSLMKSCLFPFWQHMSHIHGLLNFARSAPTKCVLSLFTSQPNTDKFLWLLRSDPKNHLTYVSLISINPRNEVLSCNHKIWV